MSHSPNNNRLRRFSAVAVTALSLCAPLGGANGQDRWVPGSGSYTFSGDTPADEACRRAAVRARASALSAVISETVASHQVLFCGVGEGRDEDCVFNETAWSRIEGRVVGARDVSRSLTVENGLAMTCSIEGKFSVVADTARPDAGFDLQLDLNQVVFRDGEAFELSVVPTVAMHVAVFQGAVADNGEGIVVRVFPNAFDPHGEIAAPTRIPAPDNEYALLVEFPEPSDEVGVAREHVMVVATRQRVDFADTYRIDDLWRRLIEIPASDRRVLMRTYAVVR